MNLGKKPKHYLRKLAFINWAFLYINFKVVLILLYYYRKFLIILGWVILIFLAYKVSQFDYEMANFDPFEILGVTPVSVVGIC